VATIDARDLIDFALRRGEGRDWEVQDMRQLPIESHWLNSELGKDEFVTPLERFPPLLIPKSALITAFGLPSPGGMRWVPVR
jgi:hypothetical protein